MTSITPARSNLSLSSVGVLQQDARLPAVRTIPTRAHPPSPLYYDYAEDFAPNAYARPEILESSSQIQIAKTIPGDLQVDTDYLDSENRKHSATENGSSHSLPSTYSPGIYLETSLEGSQLRQTRKPSTPGPKHEVLQSPSTRNLQNKFGYRPIDNTHTIQCTVTPELDSRVQASQTLPEERSVLVQLSAADNIDRHGSTEKSHSKRDISSDYCRSVLASEDNNIGPISVDVRSSLTFDHKSFAYDGSCTSFLQPSSSFLDESKASGEDLNSLGASTLPLISHDSDQLRKNDNSPNVWMRLDAITLPNSNQQSVLNCAERPLLADPEQPKVTARSFCTPIQLYSTSPKTFLQYRKEEKWLQTSISSTELNLNSQAQIPLHFGSLECSSLYGVEESHPLYDQNLDTGSLDSLRLSDDNYPNVPRFRLKITQPSDSVLGTVRVNRASADSKPLVVLEQRNTRNLFPSSSGIENTFQQASRHLHAPRPSSSSIHSQIEKGQTSILAPIPNQLSDNRQSSSELNIPQLFAATANPLNPSDVQSFFSDDSSHIYGKHNLRKRLSNLRARVIIPYATKNGAHSYDGSYSYDDANWRDGNGGQQSMMLATRSAGYLSAVEAQGEASRRRRLKDRIHAQKLKGKVMRWIREVKSAIIAHMKPRSLHYSRSEEDDAGGLTNV